ncbi:MAG: UDP-N-acetylglucosamine 2-epimerase (non-hydrolyzing) [Planctomycetota bacterium]
MKIQTVVGARPQFVKAAMLASAFARLRESRHDVEHQIVHTGQHYDAKMSGAFFEELGIPEPVSNLGVAGGTHGEMTGAMLPLLEREIRDSAADCVVVIGDTNSTMAAALAAAKLCVPVAHVEAGMRHYKRDIPEEINRVVTDHLSDLLFCSSEHSRKALEREGITEGVSVPGDVSYDLFLWQAKKLVEPKIEGEFAACTIHRAANTDDGDRLRSILGALAECPIPVVLPMHPRTVKSIERHGAAVPANVRVLEPVNHAEMLGLVAASRFVVTDSGGLQKEAYFSGKRCITLSEVSPWQELIDLDADLLVGADRRKIVAAFEWAMRPLAATPRPYGEGDAADRMAAAIVEYLT